jgi:hypothetical protein
MAVGAAVVWWRIIKAAAVNGEETTQIFNIIVFSSLHGGGSADTTAYLNQGEWLCSKKRDYLA